MSKRQLCAAQHRVDLPRADTKQQESEVKEETASGNFENDVLPHLAPHTI